MGNNYIICFSHSNDRPWPCSECTKAFKTKGRLKDHMLTHSDARPHICDKCGTGFKYPHNLRNHIKGVHKNDV